MVGKSIEPPGAFIEGPDIASNCGVADFADADAGRARGLDMVLRPVQMMLELEPFGADAEASPVTGFDCCRMEIADDDRRACVRDAGKLGLGFRDGRQMTEHEAAPHHIERA